MLDADVLQEMAYTQKKAERVITGLERPLNDHLLRLWIDPESSQRQQWLMDLVNWIDEIGEIVLRPGNNRPPHIFYYKLLFFEPFGGGAEIPNLLRRLRRLQRQGFCLRDDIEPEALLHRLRTFHRDLSSLWAAKLMRIDQIHTFLAHH